MVITAWFGLVIFGYIIFVGVLSMYSENGMSKDFMWMWFFSVILFCLSAGTIWGGLRL